MRSSQTKSALTGVRVLVGRARHQAGALSSALRARGAQVLEVPLIEIRPPRSYSRLDAALKQISRYHWLILTSVNGVESFFDRLGKLGVPKGELKHLCVAAIGPATRKAIERHGVKVDIVPAEYVAEAVVKSLRGKVKGKRVLLARARVARDLIPRSLRQLGARVDVVEAYQTVTPKKSKQDLRRLLRDLKRRPQVVALTSSSTARNFVFLAGAECRPGEIRFASIGPVTSATLRELGLPPDIEAVQYTIPGLVRAIVKDRKKF